MAEVKNTVTEAVETEVKETKVAKKTTKKASTSKTSTAKKATGEKKTTKKASSEPKKAKKETKKVQEVKPVKTEATAKVLGLKCTPRKVRLVLDLVRGKDVDEALSILTLVHKEAATPVAKLIKSAMANATNNFNMDADKLYIASIQASDSFKMRRYLPRAKGSASGLVKRFSNVFITLKERQ